MTVGIIRVLTSDDQDFVDTHGRIIQDEFGLDFVARCIPDQSLGIHSDDTFNLAVPKIVELGKKLVDEFEVSSIFVSCAADPGVAELRAELSVPVVGAGSSGAFIALACATKVGVLGITDEVPVAVSSLLGDRLVAALVPDGVQNTVDLMTPEGRTAALRAGETLKAQGATCILFACTGLTTIGLRPELATQLGIPVVDAVLAGGSVLQHVEVFSRP